jgi:hypothetical protein
MKRILFAAAMLSATVLAGCETATPYQPLHARGTQASGGYFDHQIEANRWQVGFKGNELTSRQTVERYLLYRAAELTTTQGYDWFEAVERHTDKKTEGYAVPDPYYAGFDGYWGPRWGLYRRGAWAYVLGARPIRLRSGQPVPGHRRDRHGPRPEARQPPGVRRPLGPGASVEFNPRAENITAPVILS